MRSADKLAALEQLPPDLREKANFEASADFSHMLKASTPAYPVIAALIWIGTDYPKDHLRVLETFSAILIACLCFRLLLLCFHDRLYGHFPRQWTRLISIPIGISALSLGLLQAHAAAVYGFSSWNLNTMVISCTCVTTGSMVTFRSRGSLSSIIMFAVLLPALAVELWLHTRITLTCAFGNACFLAFSVVQAKRYSADYWQHLIQRYREDQRTREIDMARQRAEEATRSRSEFLANMSHEIRTPMNAVMGTISLLRDERLSAEASDYVNTIRTSSEALLTIINDILDFSKIESGKLQLENEPLCLRDCIEEVLELLAWGASQKQIELAAEVDAGIAEWVYGDVTRLRQILLNLVGNAVKFTERGHVLVSASLTKRDQGGELLKLSVCDTGIGIPKDKIGTLFQTFTQVDASTTRRFGGTGLGLAICKKLAELMQGSVAVTSELGVGSVFDLELPYLAAPLQETPLVPSPDWAGKTILILTEYDFNRRSLAATLSAWGFQCVATASGEQAFNELRTKNWDALLLNSRFLNDLNSELDTAATPTILLIPSHDKPAPDNDLLPNGLPPAAVLTRPVRRHQLHRALNRVLNTETPMEIPAPAKMFDSGFADRFPLRILLAEDNPVNRKIGIRLFAKYGYQVEGVCNGLEVLHHLRHQIFDLVFMDIHMPLMDGMETTRKVISEWGDSRPWIVALTANSMKGSREECLSQGFDDFLAKPINMREVEESLKRCYENKGRKVAELTGAV